MRRAAVLARRAARNYQLRRRHNCVFSAVASRHASGARYLSSGPNPRDEARPSSNSAMYWRRFSIALASTAVATGAWFAYRDVGSASPEKSVLEPTSQAGSGRALVVENDQFYTESIVGDQALHKATDDAGRKILEMMTPEQATQKLRRNEESYLVGRGRGVVRYDVVQIPSNDPIEDDHAEKIVEVPQSVAATRDGSSSSDWMFWGVFDGHSGWTTSAKLRQVLISFVARELNATYKSALADPSLTIPTPEAIDAAIKKGFLRLDHEIIHESVEKVLKANSKRVAAELLAPALSGSCALLSFYDSHSKMLRVACTGDSRAVLGRRGRNGKWTATALSVDQTGSNEDEAARLRREHPGEEHVVRNGRVLGGLEPTRAFGDASYKWTRDTQDKIKGSFFGRTPSQLLRTPPYVTAEPVVSTTEVDPVRGDFVVMATDGLWEMLTNEEVVGLVGQWLEAQQRPGINPAAASEGGKSWLGSWIGPRKPSLPIETEDHGGADPKGQKAPVRQRQWGVNPDGHSRFVVEDKNAATHLVRNALGGKDKDMVCALLTLPSPFSRRYRDDLTVEVIFFGQGDNSGNVSLNAEASAVSNQPKAKL